MARINENFSKLQAGYLFPEIGRRTREFLAQNPGVEVMRLGIGDTTEPLTPTVIEGLRGAVERLGDPDTYTGYGDNSLGDPPLREAIAQRYARYGAQVAPDEVCVSDGAKSFESYGDIILKDPGLALHTLNQLQAGSKKKLRTEISSMAQAAMMLGVDRAKRLTMGHPQLERSLSGYARTGYIRTACRAFHAAFQAWDWAHIKNDHAPEEILLAALLHDVAEMALWVSAPEKMHQFRKLLSID